jgi:hypothetical protein
MKALRRRQANTDRGVATRRRTTRPFQQRTARGGRAPLAQPGCAPRAWRAGKGGGLARHAWTDRPHRRPSAWSTRNAGRDRAAGQRRQPRRRRITPNTNTTTTTMISTHNHVDMAASLVGPGQLKLTLLPATRASNSVTARPPRGPGSTAALRAGSRGPLRPAHRSGLAGLLPAAATRPPGGAEPFGHAQANCCSQLHMGGEPGQASTDPPDHSAPDRGCGEAEKSLPWVVGERCEHGAVETLWQTPRRRCQSDGARLRRTPNLRPGPLHRPALPVQPRSALRDPPRVGPAAGNSAATPHPKLLGDRWSPPHGGCFNVATCAATGDLHHSAGMPLLTPLGTARTAVLCSVYRAEFLSI